METDSSVVSREARHQSPSSTEESGTTPANTDPHPTEDMEAFYPGMTNINKYVAWIYIQY